MTDDRYRIPEAQQRTWGPLLSSRGLKRVLGRKRHSRGIGIYPDIQSDAPDFLRMTGELAETLTSSFKVTANDDGTVGPNAVAGDFLQLLTVAGYGMNPTSLPPVFNDNIRAQLGLKTDFVKPRHREIAVALMKVMFSQAVPAKVGIRREASTGSPDYVNDVPKKKMELRKALQNLEAFLNLVEKGNLRELFVEFNASIIQTLGERTQADKVIIRDGLLASKDREVNDEAAARSGLAPGKGRRFVASKKVKVSGQEIVGHFAGRRRTVYGMSFVPNYVLASFCAAWRAVYLDRYAFTWKHRTPESILEKMKKFRFLAGFDVKQFDQTVGDFMVQLFTKELENYVDRRVAKLVSLMFHAPFIAPSPYIAGEEGEPINPLFGEDPFDTGSFDLRLGLPSGIAINPDFGKFAMTCQYLCIIDDYYHDVLEFGLDGILRGEHPKYGLLNMGDDCVILMNDPDFHTSINSGSYTADYFAVEPESPISFLGNVPFRDDRGELHLAPNIVSFFVNWLVPEHGVEHFRRRNFWAVGDRERRQYYAKAPAYHDAYVIYEEIFQKHLHRRPSAIALEYYETQRKFGSMSFIDALVLQKPDYLQYRFDENDVSPEILDQLVTSIPAEEVWEHIRGFLL